MSKIQSITKVKNLWNPKYPFALIFQESFDDACDPESIAGVKITLVDGSSYVVMVDTEGETMVMKVTGECPDCEKERMGMKPGLVAETQLAPGITQTVGEGFTKAWSCRAPEDPGTEVMKVIKKALKKSL